jgi:hypothetical protein
VDLYIHSPIRLHGVVLYINLKLNGRVRQKDLISCPVIDIVASNGPSWVPGSPFIHLRTEIDPDSERFASR